jgi:mRNA-degrading endonuclease RelE of RelBE toxin-antitoxin system
MKSYSVLLTQTAEKELSRLPNKEIKKIVEILKFLEENPRPIGPGNLCAARCV